MTVAVAIPPSWLMERCQRLTPFASATASTVPLTWTVGPLLVQSDPAVLPVHAGGGAQDLGHGFLGRKARGQGPGVQFPLGRNKQPVPEAGGPLKLAAKPLDVYNVYANANNHAAYSTVTLLARLRGWSTS